MVASLPLHQSASHMALDPLRETRRQQPDSGDAGKFERRTRRIQGPGSGRNEMYGTGLTCWPGSRVSENRWAIVARSSTASIVANVLPMHWRGPPPKGK